MDTPSFFAFICCIISPKWYSDSNSPIRPQAAQRRCIGRIDKAPSLYIFRLVLRQDTQKYPNTSHTSTTPSSCSLCNLISGLCLVEPT